VAGAVSLLPITSSSEMANSIGINLAAGEPTVRIGNTGRAIPPEQSE
jgi:hypothetical protein